MKLVTTIRCAAVIAGLMAWYPVNAQGARPLSALRAARNIQIPPPSVRLQGIMVSNTNWTDDSQAGVYELEGRPGGKVTPLHRSPAMIDVAAAVVKDNVMYCVEANTEGMYYRTYSTTNWSGGTRQEIDVQNVPSDLTYDAVTDKVYGGFWDVDYNGYSRFASFGLATAEATDIVNPNRDERDIFAIAAAPDGTIYGLFGAYNYLATFNPVTGAAERLGRTDLSVKANLARHQVSSMCYDAANRRLLAAVYTESGYGADRQAKSGLYEINPANGHATLLYNLDGAACIAGLRVVDDRPDAAAPAAVGNLKVTFQPGSLTQATLSFDMPALSVGGAPLAEQLLAVISVNGTELALDGLSAGQHVDTPVSLAGGTNVIAVTAADSLHRGQRTDLQVWAGEDVPAAVSAVRLSCGEQGAQLSWTAPVQGANGGMLVPENLRYRIKRYPDATVVADAHADTTFTDSNLNPAWKAVYYEVQAYNSQGAAAAVASNKCPAAGAMSIPFVEGFDSQADFDVWTVINANGGSTWTYGSQSAVYTYHSENLPGDDWLVSPPLRVQQGQAYKVSYAYRAYNAKYPESFEVFVGERGDVAGLTTLVAQHPDFNNTANQTGEAQFTATRTGDMFVAFHNCSRGKMWKMYLDDICVEPLDSRVPAAPANVKVTPAAQGALSATVSFTAPTLDSDGGQLVGLKSATVTRLGAAQPVAVITDIAPGQTVSVTDTVTASDVYTYSVVCTNDIGSSLAASAKAFVGVDVPGSVLNLTVTEVDRHPVLSWEAPDRGANGGWFAADNLTYRIVRSDGQVVIEGTRELSHVDTGYTSPAQSQEAVWYLVTPYSGTAKGAWAQSELTLVGKPYATPCAETFANADMKYYPWIAQSSNAVNYSWTLETAGAKPATPDQSGDRGLARFHSVGEPAGTVSYFYSPMFDLSGMTSPCVTFYMYHSPSMPGDAKLRVLADGGDGFEDILTEPLRRDAAERDGWVRHSVLIPDYLATGRCRIGFCATGDGVADIYLDNVSFDNVAQLQASLVRVEGPRRIAAGVEADISATVLNSGTEAIADARLELFDGDVAVATSTVPTLAPGAEAKVQLPCTFEQTGSRRLDVKLTLTQNNAEYSSQHSLDVLEPVLVAPAAPVVTTDLDGCVMVHWGIPDPSGAVTEDVESHAPWAIDGVGEWTMFDGDYDLTYYINKDAGEYANATARKAFQVLDVKQLGIDIWEEGKAHSGNRMFAALACMNYENNDWLISPRLNGAAQWVSFYARSFTLKDTPAERMKVWYSTTDTDAANFTAVTPQYVELDGTWREYRYYLPEGARYFAVNCVSNGSFAMFVDDLRYNDLTVPRWSVTGYELYRNGELIATTDDPVYTDRPQPGRCEYAVRALYDRDGAASPMSPVTVYDHTSAAAVTGDTAPAAVYNLQGIRVGTADRLHTLPAGIYIVNGRKVIRK